MELYFSDLKLICERLEEVDREGIMETDINPAKKCILMTSMSGYQITKEVIDKTIALMEVVTGLRQKALNDLREKG